MFFEHRTTKIVFNTIKNLGVEIGVENMVYQWLSIGITSQLPGSIPGHLAVDAFTCGLQILLPTCFHAGQGDRLFRCDVPSLNFLPSPYFSILYNGETCVSFPLYRHLNRRLQSQLQDIAAASRYCRRCVLVLNKEIGNWGAMCHI